MNRLTALILTALLALSALTGCASTSTPTAESTPSTGSNAPIDSSSTLIDNTTNTLTPTSADDFPDTPISEFKYKYDAELKGVVITAYTGNSSLKVRMKELNESIKRISTIINEQDVTEALSHRVKQNLKDFFRTFDEFSYKDGMTNAGLKSVIKEIKVINKALLHVYFNVDDSVEGLFFPITITGSLLQSESVMTDTESLDRTYGSDNTERFFEFRKGVITFVTTPFPL